MDRTPLASTTSAQTGSTSGAGSSHNPRQHERPWGTPKKHTLQACRHLTPTPPCQIQGINQTQRAKPAPTGPMLRARREMVRWKRVARASARWPTQTVGVGRGGTRQARQPRKQAVQPLAATRRATLSAGCGWHTSRSWPCSCPNRCHLGCCLLKWFARHRRF